MSPFARPSLGAIELIEVGDSRRAAVGGSPVMFSTRARLAGLEGIGAFLAGILEGALGLLADIVGAPLSLLSQGVDWVFTNIASVIGEIPVLGTLVAQVLLIANAAIKFALNLPGMLLTELSNVFGGLRKVFEGQYGEDERKDVLKEAKDEILGDTPPDLKDRVAAVIGDTDSEAETDFGTSPPSDADGGDGPGILDIALPSAAAVAALWALAG